MMKSKVLFYAIALAVIFAGCASEENNQNDLGYKVIENPEYGEFQNQEPSPFEFVLQDSIPVETPDNFIVSRLRYLVADPAGNMYFLETAQGKLISFSSEGEFRWMTGQQGRGPGDFDRPTHLLAGEQYLYVVNVAGSRIDLFDFEGNYQRSISLDQELSLPKLRGFTGNGQLVLTTPLWSRIGSNIYLTKLTEDSLTIQHHFELDRSGGREFGSGNSAASDIVVEGNQLVLGSKTDYSISRYDLEGNLISKVTRDFDRIIPPGYHDDGDYGMFTSFGGMEYLQKLPGNYSMVLAQWPTNITDPNENVRKRMQGNAERTEFKHSLDVFNPEYKLVYSFEGEGLNPPQGTLSHIGKDGTLYFTKENTEAVIYRYTLTQKN